MYLTFLLTKPSNSIYSFSCRVVAPHVMVYDDSDALIDTFYPPGPWTVNIRGAPTLTPVKRIESTGYICIYVYLLGTFEMGHMYPCKYY